jgi:hypothetical protein
MAPRNRTCALASTLMVVAMALPVVADDTGSLTSEKAEAVFRSPPTTPLTLIVTFRPAPSSVTLICIPRYRSMQARSVRV